MRCSTQVIFEYEANFRNAFMVVNIVTTLIIKHYIDEQIEISHVIVLIIGS